MRKTLADKKKLKKVGRIVQRKGETPGSGNKLTARNKLIAPISSHDNTRWSAASWLICLAARSLLRPSSLIYF